MKKLIVFVFFLTLFAACKKNQVATTFFELSTQEISLDALGGSQIINVRSSDKWEIENEGIPSWIQVNAKDFYTLELILQANEDSKDRSAVVSLKSAEKVLSIHIQQEGATPSKEDEKDSFSFIPLPMSRKSFEISDDGTALNISYDSYFMHPSIAKRIFHGCLLEKEMTKEGFPMIYSDEYTYNEIVLSTYAYPIRSVTAKASYKTTDAFFQKIKSTRPKSNVSFFSGSPKVYHSYKQLHFTGMGNLGLPLDEFVFGKSYKEKEMKKGYSGLLYSYSQTLFSVAIDYPEQLVVEKIPEDKAKDLLYVSQINYGRTGLLLVEADGDVELLQKLVRKLMKEETLTESEQDLSDRLKAYYISIDENSGNFNKKSGSIAIKAYVDGMKNGDIIPLNFELSNYLDFAAGSLKYTMTLP